MGKRTLHRLTAKAVEKANEPGRKYHDGGGLYLQVGPTGTKSWIFRFMRNGKTRWGPGLGSIADTTLAEARVAAQEARKVLQSGRDPIVVRDALLAEGKAAEGRSKLFSHCAAAYIEANQVKWRNEKHVEQWKSTLKTYCYPDPPQPAVWRDLPASAIDTARVMEVLEPIWQTKTETASRLRGRIEAVLDWAKVRGYRDGENPARWKGHLDKLLPKRSEVQRVRHHPALPFDALPAFMRDLRKFNGTAARALELIILTATRTSEALEAKWSEIDLRQAMWKIPAERMKAKRVHKIPLSAAAIGVLRTVKEQSTDGKEQRPDAYVFPGLRPNRPLSNMACLAVLDRMKRDDIVVHGFRSTFSDWAAERTNFPRDVVEMALAHAVRDKTEAAYRRGDLFEKRRKLMEAWAQHCYTTKSASVTPIQEAKRKKRA